MNIREMKQEDTQQVLDMMRIFYDSPAVIHKAPDEILLRDIEDSIGDNPYIEGYVLEENGTVAGYSMLARSYSTEYGGLCVWIEDIYIKPEYQGHGMGAQFFEYIHDLYKDKAVRFRLEAEEDNVNAVRLYKRCGYSELPYMQLTRELED